MTVSRIGILDEKLPPSLKLELEEGAKVRDVVDLLEDRYGGIKGELYRNAVLKEGCRILLNGRSIASFNGLETVVEGEARLLFTILIHGG